LKNWISNKYAEARRYFENEPQDEVKRCDALAWIAVFFAARRVMGLPVRWVFLPTAILAVAIHLVTSVSHQAVSLPLATITIIFWLVLLVIFAMLVFMNAFFFLYEWHIRLVEDDDDNRKETNMQALRRAWGVLTPSMRFEAGYYAAGIVAIVILFAISAIEAVVVTVRNQMHFSVPILLETIGFLLLVFVSLALVWYGAKLAKRISNILKQNSTLCPVIRIESE